MPNWCEADFDIYGTKANIKKFCDFFIFEEEANKNIKKHRCQPARYIIALTAIGQSSTGAGV